MSWMINHHGGRRFFNLVTLTTNSAKTQESFRMDRSSVSRKLDGGFIVEHDFDLIAKSLRFRIEVLNAGSLSVYDLQFLAVSELHFDDELGGCWERLELREIVIDQVPEGSATEEWAVWLNFWDTAQLRLKCAQILIDGTPLR